MLKSTRMTKSFLFLLALILAFPFIGKSQYFSTGQDPDQIKWRQINTDNFQIIYPEEYEAKAQQVAWVFEKVYDYGSRTLNHAPRKISVILHTHTVKSNGLVAWSPKRVELFTTPHQDMYAQDWLEQLAVHEFRHVVQMDKIQQELPDLLPVLFGEQAAAAVVGAYLPFWFVEGDAVVLETALSKSGRGRKASFLMENKAQVLEKGLYSYNKASLGSYKDFVPNRYKFGYWMVGGIREKYGPKIWSDVLDEIARKPLSITPVNRVLKKETGFTQNGLYEKLFNEYRTNWQKEIDHLQLTPNKKITSEPIFFTNYSQAHAINDSTFVALKDARSDRLRIVKIGPAGEQIIATPGSIFNESFSAEKNLLIWSELRPDIRWSHADRSVIVVYNRETGARQEFHPENKLFSPVISPDLLHFAAVEVDKTNQYYLSVFDLLTGKRIKQYFTPDNSYFFTPCWNTNGDELFFIALSSAGKSLTSLNLKTGQMTTLLNAGFQEIRNPRFKNGQLCFTGSFTGIDNIYSIQLDDHKIYQLTSVPFGADYPVVCGNKLLFSNYSANGYQLCSMKLNDALKKPFTDIQPKTYALADSLANQEATVLDFTGKMQADFPSRRYHKFAHLFNFHSWAPAYISTNSYDLKPGVSLFSQNKLGTAETRLGYKYNWEEEAGKYQLGFKYSGFFPVLDAEMNYGKRSSNYHLIQNTVDQSGNIVKSDTTTQRFEWQELSLDASIYVPLRFSQGKYSQLVQPELDYSYKKLSHTNTTPEEFYSGYYHSLTYRLYFQNVLNMSELDILPPWGQVIDLIYRDGLNGFGGSKASDVGHLKAIQSYLFFPGFSRNHGIKLYNAYQQNQMGSSFAFGNAIHFPRGYSSFQNTSMYSMGIDYVMPLLYPDFSIGRLIYLKRIRTSLFYDFANLERNNYSKEGEIVGNSTLDMNSLGIELIGDGHILRIVAPISAGIRGMYLPTTKNIQFQFLFSIDLNSL